MELLLLVDAKDLKDKKTFEKHLQKEGFNLLENENFTYIANSSSTTYATKIYILEVVKEALSKTSFVSCNIVFQLGNLPSQAYKFDKSCDDFIKV